MIHGGLNMSHKTMKVLIVEPGKAPYAAEIPAGLESLQEKVEGLIQALYSFEDSIAVICNVELCIMLSRK
jgi:hypothetical protein